MLAIVFNFIQNVMSQYPNTWQKLQIIESVSGNPIDSKEEGNFIKDTSFLEEFKTI